MSQTDRSSLLVRGLQRVRRPSDVIEATRWLFAGLALASLLLGLLTPVAAGPGWPLVAALTGSALLALSIGASYVRRTSTISSDVLDGGAVLAIATASPQPVTALGIVFAALWFRSLYGSTGRAVLRCALYAGAMAASLALWPAVHSGAAEAAAGPVLGAVPTMFLTVIVGRHLASSLRARERAARLDAVHVLVGAQLLGVTDAEEIRRIAWEAVAGICAAIPGLRVLKVVGDGNGDVLGVGGAAGGFASVPGTFRSAVLSVPGESGEPGIASSPARAELDTAVGAPCAWACVPLPGVKDQRAGWLLVGAPRTVPAEAVVALGSLANQVTLALRNSEVHQELTVQATLDSLTGLANRPSFNAALSRALDHPRDQPTTVLFVDLDDFKDVNDVLGHGAGDDLLREIAARLHRATRPEDLCARLGGDEFAVLLHGTDSSTGSAVAQRIVNGIAAPAQLLPGVANVGASVGVATSTGESDLEELVHRADIAMYAAKAKGKGRVQVFEAGLLQGDSTQLLFERELSAAAVNGELVIHYQPIVSLPEQRCTAVEALVRWQHPERGLLYPDSFIDAAESTGAIRDIGSYVLRQACADVAFWRAAEPGLPLAVHVNVSALQLDDDGFFDTVARCLGEFDLPPEALVLEITETVVIASSTAVDQLNALAGYGVTIAIDDFGTGYSALTTLRSLPVQIVKIDKSFIAGSTVNAEDRAVTEAIVKMAAQMGMQTIAEGVERLDQQEFLESIGADAVQGFLYLRPTTAVGFGSWLAAHVADQPSTASHDAVVVPFAPRHSA
jgi:diguanylate cyclase (GGDEF)-like protein